MGLVALRCDNARTKIKMQTRTSGKNKKFSCCSRRSAHRPGPLLRVEERVVRLDGPRVPPRKGKRAVHVAVEESLRREVREERHERGGVDVVPHVARREVDRRQGQGGGRDLTGRQGVGGRRRNNRQWVCARKAGGEAGTCSPRSDGGICAADNTTRLGGCCDEKR